MKIYGERPTGEAWEKRVKKDKIDLSKIQPAIKLITRYNGRGGFNHYGIKVWAMLDELQRYWTYRYRRDGKIEMSWTPVDKSHLDFNIENEDVQF